MSLEYGNARVAACRSRLLDRAAIGRLAESATSGVFLAALDRADDWTAIVRAVLPLGGDPAVVTLEAIERHRSVRLGALPGWYEGRTRALVEALVLPLDAERVLALLRRRRAGGSVEAMTATIVPGALLDARMLASLVRSQSAGRERELLIESGVLDGEDASRPSGLDAGSPAVLEASIVAAFVGARARRARGRGGDARRVRAQLAREAADRATTEEALRDQGPAAATLLDRSLTLARLAEIAHAGPRDPLGIGAACGYVAAVELQAIRLRAALARAGGGWQPEQLAPYVAAPQDRRWPVLSS